MNSEILNKYGIAFHKYKDDKELVLVCKQATVSDLSYCLCGYLNSQPYSEYLSGELLAEIVKAIQGRDYTIDGGGEDIFGNWLSLI